MKGKNEELVGLLKIDFAKRENREHVDRFLR